MSNPVLKDLYGVGFSPLSISNKKYAHEEELMANKEAGLLAIFQKDGSVISADHLLRCKRHLEQFTQKCINDGTLGKVYKISPNEDLVQNIKSTQNLFTDTLTFNSPGEVDFSFIRFSIDYDCFAKETSAVFDPADIRVQINFTHKIKENPEAGETYYIDSRGNKVIIDEEDREFDVSLINEMGEDSEISAVDNAGREYLQVVADTARMYPPNPTKSYNIEESLADINDKAYAIDYDWYPGDTARNSIILNSFDIILPVGFNPSKVGLVIHDILFAIK